MSFYEIEIPVAASDCDSVEAALLHLGASSITFLSRGDEAVLEPKPGEIKLWQSATVLALFAYVGDPAPQAMRTLQGLAAACDQAAAQARIRAVPDEAWERAWLKDWTSMRFGRRLWICPTAAANPDDPEAVTVRLDPGLAFGTGSHPTTALCLQILDSLPLRGRVVIDYGCGSGILGLSALKLGAAHVTAVDIDPQALLATRANARRNHVAEFMTLQTAEQSLSPAYCVVANILAEPLIELAAKLTAACEARGHLLLSGILKTQAYAVRAAYAAGFAAMQTIERDEWCCIHARRVH